MTAEEINNLSGGEDSRIEWYVIHTYSGYENKVADDIRTKSVNDPNVNGKILDAIVPTKKVTETVEVAAPRKDSDDEEDPPKKPKKMLRTREVERKIFPGYVMVKVKVFYDLKTKSYKMTDETWYVIRNTRGVTGFVGPENKPLPLTAQEVANLGFEQEEVKTFVAVDDFVEIVDEPYTGRTGQVSEVDIEKGTVVVMLSTFGQQTPVEISIESVRKVEY